MPKRCDICGGRGNPTEYEGRPVQCANNGLPVVSVRRIVLCEDCGCILAEPDSCLDAEASARERLSRLLGGGGLENGFGHTDIVSAIVVGLPDHRLRKLKKRLDKKLADSQDGS